MTLPQSEALSRPVISRLRTPAPSSRTRTSSYSSTGRTITRRTRRTDALLPAPVPDKGLVPVRRRPQAVVEVGGGDLKAPLPGQGGEKMGRHRPGAGTDRPPVPGNQPGGDRRLCGPEWRPLRGGREPGRVLNAQALPGGKVRHVPRPAGQGNALLPAPVPDKGLVPVRRRPQASSRTRTSSYSSTGRTITRRTRRTGTWPSAS